MKTPYILPIIIILLSACTATQIPTPVQADVDRVSSKFPDVSLTQLQQGKTIFESHCGQCHKLKNPATRTEEKLNKIVPKMFLRVARKEGKPLDKSDEQLILQYLVTMSKKSGEK